MTIGKEGREIKLLIGYASKSTKLPLESKPFTRCQPKMRQKCPSVSSS